MGSLASIPRICSLSTVFLPEMTGRPGAVCIMTVRANKYCDLNGQPERSPIQFRAKLQLGINRRLQYDDGHMIRRA